MIIIDTSVWILVLNGSPHPKADLARTIIEGAEDIGVPGIVLEEVLRGFRKDSQFRRVRDLLLDDFTYLEMTRAVFLRSAEIYRALRKRGSTLRSPVDCLVAACALEEDASLLENDADFRVISRVAPLSLVGAG